MSRFAWVVFVLSTDVLAHPGHGAPDAHFHAGPMVVLAVLMAACAIFRAVKFSRRLRDRRQVN